MRAQVIPIGNSRGVRIPSSLLKLCHIVSEIDLKVKGNSIVIRPLGKHPRQGWADAFKKMRGRTEDRLLISDRIGLNEDEWEW